MTEMFIKGEVIFPPVTVKIHWPEWFCSQCGQEMEVFKPPSEVYLCPSCGWGSTGKTQFIGGKVHQLA